ncbi:MAG TPA: M50 family metallopeptidase [Candidatus Saccharimonadales bacterium]|nr:M50 family metallopeptidase [Candidatus Saccharimonadales bacterium]
MDILIFLLGILLLVGLIVLHEFGHAIAAKRNGVQVEEFGIGFPPKAWGRKLKNGTEFTLNWLPLGGFVKLKGEHDSAQGPGTYGGASLWAKVKILMAGVAINWATAVVIFTFLALVGIPKLLPHQFAVQGDNTVVSSGVKAGSVSPSSPAAKAGLQQGDKLISLGGEPVQSAAGFSQQTAAHAGQTTIVEYERGGEVKKVEVTLNKDRADGQGHLGVGPMELTTQRATWSAPIVGVGLTAQLTYETFKGLATTVADLFQAKFAQAGANVAGPIGIVNILKDSSSLGVVPVLFLLGVISLTLAVMNTLPIPALDGGRLFVTLLFRAIKKPLTKEREESIQFAGFMVLMALLLVITVLDVKRFF